MFNLNHIGAMLLLLFFLFLQKKEQRQYNIYGYAQGTDYAVKYFATDSIVTKGAIDSILMVIDSSMSLYKPYSLISQFNRSQTGMKLDKHFSNVIMKSFEIYKDTRGNFDPTVKPLVQAWGFGTKPVESFPDSAEVLRILRCVGMDQLTYKAGFLRKAKACVELDLNGIAQGYSVDVVADFLTHRGIRAFVVEIGGELRMKGPKPDGKPLRIGIEGPADQEHTEPSVRHVVALNNGAITTSGNYRKFLQRGKSRVSHLIDAKTGFPLNNALISVTIYASDAVTADGYDNAIMAMRLEEALAFVAKKKDMEAYIIYHREDGSVADTLTSGFKKLMVN